MSSTRYLNYLIYVKRPLSIPDPQQHFLHVLVYSQHEEAVKYVEAEGAKPGIDVLLTRQRIAVNEGGLRIEIRGDQEVIQDGKREVELPERSQQKVQRDFCFQVDKGLISDGLVKLGCIVGGIETQVNPLTFRWVEPSPSTNICINASAEHSVGLQNNSYHDSHHIDNSCHVSCCDSVGDTCPSHGVRLFSRWCSAIDAHVTCLHLVVIGCHLPGIVLLQGGMLDRFFGYYLPPPVFAELLPQSVSESSNVILLAWLFDVVGFTFTQKRLRHRVIICTFLLMVSLVSNCSRMLINILSVLVNMLPVIPLFVLFLDIPSSIARSCLRSGSPELPLLSTPILKLLNVSSPTEIKRQERWNLCIHTFILILHFGYDIMLGSNESSSLVSVFLNTL